MEKQGTSTARRQLTTSSSSPKHFRRKQMGVEVLGWKGGLKMVEVFQTKTVQIDTFIFEGESLRSQIFEFYRDSKSFCCGI